MMFTIGQVIVVAVFGACMFICGVLIGAEGKRLDSFEENF